jgi:hypothetical protein
MTTAPIGHLLARVLGQAGIHGIYGAPLPGMVVTSIEDIRVAEVLSSVHRAVHGSAAATHLGDGLLRISGDAVFVADAEFAVTDATDLDSLASSLSGTLDGTGFDVRLGIDPQTPVLDTLAPRVPPETWSEPESRFLEPLEKASNVVVLAGPGVVRHQAVDRLHAFAATGHLGVLNSWGAKGVFPWQSRHHWATVGLQECDFDYCGLDKADLIVAVGIDERETPKQRWGAWPHLVVRPADLGPLAECWNPKSISLDPPALRARLAAVTQAGWVSSAVPMSPTRVTRHYAQALAGGGLLAADAGLAGYWVARTFATSQLGEVLVPPKVVPGWAVACNTVARLANPMRPALAVVDGPLDDISGAVIDTAARLGISIGVEAWSADGDWLRPDAHLQRLGPLVSAGFGGAHALCTGEKQIEDMIVAAGPIIAWRPSLGVEISSHLP